MIIIKFGLKVQIKNNKNNIFTSIYIESFYMKNRKKIEIEKILQELSNSVENIGCSEDAVREAIMNKRFIRTRDGKEYLPVCLENNHVLSLSNDDKAKKVPFYKIKDIFDNGMINEQENNTSLEYEALIALLNGNVDRGSIKMIPYAFYIDDFNIDFNESGFITEDKEVYIKWSYKDNIFETNLFVDVEIDYTSPKRIIPASIDGPEESVGDSASVNIKSAGEQIIVDNLTNGEQFSEENISDELRNKINNFLKGMDGISYRN